MGRVILVKYLKEKSVPLVLIVSAIVLSASAVIAYYRYTTDHLPPNISINDIPIGTLTYTEAETLLESTLPAPPPHSVTASVDGIAVSSESAQLGLRYNYKNQLEKLRHSATRGRLRDKTMRRIKPLFSPQSYTSELEYDDQKITELLHQLNAVVAYDGQKPSVSLTTSNNPESIKVFAGKRGRVVDVEKTKQLLNDAISPQAVEVTAVVASTAAELTPEEVTASIERSRKFVGKSILFNYDNRDYEIADKELVSFLNLPSGYNTDLIDTKVATIAAQVNRAPQEPVFEYDPKTLVVKKFLPPLNGLSLNKEKTIEQILAALQQRDAAGALSDNDKDFATYELAVATTPPQRSLADTNTLGIKEQIGFGDSHYDHSIPNRVHNVSITTERITNVIIPPGAEFSFNKTLGDVSAETGFRSAYVIKNGQTALGDGGGVCQVSTTLFRSVLDAGLKVTRRLPHSYRVSYYELDTKPGVDATVYSGETDFRFINDTSEHVLIHAEADSKDLYMFVSIYGTSDGRTTDIKDHITWNARPAPAPQYFPDPTLPEGKLVQIDWAASGISASFINVIKDKDGKVIREDKYVSHYRPWSAKYRQGVPQ